MLRAEIIGTKTIREAIATIYSDLPADSAFRLRMYAEVKKALNGRAPAPAYLRNILALLKLTTPKKIALGLEEQCHRCSQYFPKNPNFRRH